MKPLKSDLRIYPKDLRPMGYCCQGAKILLESYGFTWKEFVKYGLTIEQLRQLDDPQVKELILWVKEKSNR